MEKLRSLPAYPAQPIVGNLFQFQKDRLGYFLRSQLELGPVSRMRIGPVESVLIGEPQLAAIVLTERAYDFVKSVFYDHLKRLLGLGLVTSEGDFHKKQRKLVAPLLQHRRIASYGATMAEYTERISADWRDGQLLDIAEEMMRITLAIVGKTLFNADVLGEARELGPALEVANRYVGREVEYFIHWPLWWPIKRTREARKAIRRIDETVYRMIEERRSTGEDKGDILSMLLSAQHEDQSRMSDEQVRDEAMTMFAAGHETTATAMGWCLWELTRNPDVYQRLQREVDSVLGGRSPTLEDLPKLPFALQCFKETMRLHPPAYVVGRRPLQDMVIDGVALTSKMMVLINIYGMHHSPEYFPEPERFDPDRFSPEREKSIPKNAYLPFATGPRVCIGNHFAMMEGQIMLAALVQRFSFTLEPGHTVEPDPLVTLRTKHGIPMRVHKRQPARAAA